MNEAVVPEKGSKSKYGLFLLMVVTLFVTLLPFLLNGPHPLGYDTGFYRRYLINPVESFPNTAVPGLDHTIILPRIFLDGVRSFGLSSDFTLYGSYILLVLIAVYSFYRLVLLYGDRKTALTASFLLVLSPVFYQAYWFLFYKNILALIFLFWTFYFLEEKKYWPAALFAIAIPLSHQGTTIVFLMIMGIFVLIRLIRHKAVLPHLLAIAATISVYLYLHPNLVNKIVAPPTGVFLETSTFLVLIAPILLCILLSFKKIWSFLREHEGLMACAIVSIVFPLLSLPYHQRTFIIANFILCVLAGVVIANVFKEKKTWMIGLAGLCILAHIGLFAWKLETLRPLVTEDHVTALAELSTITDENASIMTSARLLPWAQGWSTGKAFAPGVLKDPRSPLEWESYWSHQNPSYEEGFLAQFPHPLYIFVDEREKQAFLPRSCIQQIGSMLYRYECPIR